MLNLKTECASSFSLGLLHIVEFEDRFHLFYDSTEWGFSIPYPLLMWDTEFRKLHYRPFRAGGVRQPVGDVIRPIQRAFRNVGY